MDANTESVAEWINDPLRFIGTYWPDAVLYDKQAEILYSVRDNRETFVHAANETGKTRVAAWAALHFFLTRLPAKVLAMSSTQDQLMQGLWPEIDCLVRTAALPLSVVRKHRELRVLEPDGKKEYADHFLRGRVAHDPEAFQGAHLAASEAVPRVLVILDEASAVADEFYDAATSQAQRLLVIGNPLSTRSFFFRYCHKGNSRAPRTGKLFRRVVHIGADDTPNVQAGKAHEAAGASGPPPLIVPGILSHEAYLERKREWEPIKQRMRLEGHFYEGPKQLMFPADWLDACEQAWIDGAQPAKEDWGGLSRVPVGPCSLGVDVAEGGRDLTAWVVIDPLGIVLILAKTTPDTSLIPAQTLAIMARYSIPSRRVAFDRGAGGKQYADLMGSHGHKVRAVTFGERARDPKTYKNRRAEMYGLLRAAVDPRHWSRNDEGGWSRCFMVPPHEHELRQELVTLPLQYDQEGKLYLPPKSPKPGVHSHETITGMIGRSPDRADALALANWARVVRVRRATPRVSGPMGATPEDVTPGKPKGKREPSALERRIFGPGGC